MITEEINKDHVYKLRSCANCTTDGCTIKQHIFHPTRAHSNCAKYGCIHYKGEYQQEKMMSKFEVSAVLKEKRQEYLQTLVKR